MLMTCGLHEQATMNRAHNLFVDEQLARIQTNRDESCCYFADHKTMQVRPASTYDLARNTRICLMELRDARAYDFEPIYQHVKTMQPDMMVAQQNEDSFSDEEIRTLYNQQVNQGGYCSTWAAVQENRIRTGTPVCVSGPNCLVSSGRLPSQERIFTFTMSPPDVLRKRQWSLTLLDFNELDRRDNGTGLSSPLGQRIWLEHWRRLTARKPSELTKSYRRSCARRFNLKRRSILPVIKTECCESIFLWWPEVTVRRYCRLTRGNLRAETFGTRGKGGRRNWDST